jgi:hypothetical protein
MNLTDRDLTASPYLLRPLDSLHCHCGEIPFDLPERLTQPRSVRWVELLPIPFLEALEPLIHPVPPLGVQTSSRFCLPQCGMKPTVLDCRKSLDINTGPLIR